ncbi:MAG: magnesium chelatase domain-containing protein [Luteolibacter sp.]
MSTRGWSKFTFVGLADRSVGEARDRARSALLNSGLPWPAMRITIGPLAGLDPEEAGPTLDLPMALTIAATQDAVPQEAVARAGGPRRARARRQAAAGTRRAGGRTRDRAAPVCRHPGGAGGQRRRGERWSMGCRCSP